MPQRTPSRVPRRRSLTMPGLAAASLTVLLSATGCNSHADLPGAATEAGTIQRPSLLSAAEPAPHASQPGTPGTNARETRQRPNVVLVVADDMRVDDLRFAPHLRDLLAAHGITFANSFSPFPLCAPSRASLLTGQYTHNHGVYWHQHPYGYGAFNDSRTLATALSDAGYQTGFVGKYINGYGLERSKVTGKRSARYVPNGWDDWSATFDNPGIPGVRGGTYHYFTTTYNHNGEIDQSHHGQYQTNASTSIAAHMVNRFHDTSKPFFLDLNYVAPHSGTPREPDDPRNVYRSDGVKEDFATPARPGWVRGRFDQNVTHAAGMPADGGPSEEDATDKPSFDSEVPDLTEQEKAALAEMTRQRGEAVYVLDQQIARLVQHLKNIGEWNNTVFMFTADNGYFQGEHRQRTGKVHTQEPALRVPFLITGPGLRNLPPEERVRYDPISSVDVPATILDIANARPPRPADGHSVWRTITDGDHGWTVPIQTEGFHSIAGAARTDPDFDDVRSSVGLRTPQYNFTLYQNGEGELYDLLVDPNEMDNRYDDPAYARVQKELAGLVAQYKDCSGASCQMPLPNSLRATPEQEAVIARGFWQAVDDRYETVPSDFGLLR